jgi:hypothetical protein
MPAQLVPCAVAVLANASPLPFYLRDQFVSAKQSEIFIHITPPSSCFEEAAKGISRGSVAKFRRRDSGGCKWSIVESG